jgi:hypothetical protein
VREPPLFVLEFFAARNRTAEAAGHDVSLYPEFQLTRVRPVMVTTMARAA